MEIQRKIYNRIVDWKNSTKGTKALLIEGTRRIGKSTVAEEFGKNEYKSYILIDFNKASSKVKAAFDDLNHLDIFFQTLSLEYKTNFRISPVEVKSSKNYTTTSLTQFSNQFRKRIGSQWIIHPKNLSISDGIIRIPPYMVSVAL